jgi:hypothetical protein
VDTEREIVAHLVGSYAPEAIVLVGSRADGCARPGSDWDLYVLLPPDRSAPRGPVPAPDTFEGELLDVALVRLPIAASEIGALFGPNLQQARVLCDNAGADAARLCAQARELYARGRALPRAEIARRRHEMARNLARMRARADEPGAFFEALTYFFYTAHRAWYEVLRDRWSVSVHRALPEIAELDPAFHRRLQTLIDGASPALRIEAAEAIFEALFAESRVVA